MRPTLRFARNLRQTPGTLSVAAALCVVMCVGAARAEAQLPPMGAGGVTIGHLHLTARDADLQRRFWTVLGGVPVANGQVQLIQLPGVYMMLRQAEPTGDMAGSSVDRFSFLVKDLQASLTKWRAAGLKIEPTAKGTEATLMAPDSVVIDLVEDKSLTVPLKMRDIHFNTTSPAETQAWYVKNFGAVPGKRGPLLTAGLPGVTLVFGKAAGAVAPTKGRALDHIGFIIKDLEPFTKKLEASGVTLDRPFRKLSETSNVTIAFVIDPWGTNIELNEHLAPE